jgi:uncharacterized protein with NAD-binding domain and iron-sulfur cluster
MTRLEKSLLNMVDLFTGADGGVDFINFRTFLESMEKGASNGDNAAEQLMLLFYRFEKMIDISKELGRKGDRS